MHEVTLLDGIKIGETVYKTLVMDVINAGQCMDAVDEAEEIRLTEKNEPIVITSEQRITAHRVRRQIKKLIADDGQEFQGPVPYNNLRSCSEGDYRKIVDQATIIDGLYASREKEAGGREEGATAEDGARPNSS
ncbi:hypothetical protein RYZ26_15295 [Terasakiella sp. A23]|uniref:hypothetical protein n=1 Tax=Terasakiella sp. FCG-A23 TaxID=3080561 RepID=UPI0029530512|nr:hypothetical protein [Terasakiella sp. A23]MDV7340970.1 hypothetical protein [Terasakiella sp. A23]